MRDLFSTLRVIYSFQSWLTNGPNLRTAMVSMKYRTSSRPNSIIRQLLKESVQYTIMHFFLETSSCYAQYIAINDRQ